VTLEEKVTEEVRALAALDLFALRQLWSARWGMPPGHRSPEILRATIAWRIQVAAFGGLSQDTKRSLRRTTLTTAPRVRLTRGAKLSREWKGVRHDVEVVDGGFAHAGVTYRSLSKVASVIAGSKWNGLRFFGLDKDYAP
jgi:hypothetical protein